MPRPSTDPKMFGADPYFLWQTKNLFTYCASLKLFAPDQKMISVYENCFFCAGTNSFWVALNTIQFLVSHKKFGQTQNILGPTEGQGMSF